MPSKMPPGWLELRNEFALRAALQKKYAQEANKLPYSEVKPMPALTEAVFNILVIINNIKYKFTIRFRFI
jgi:hypothetical protein